MVETNDLKTIKDLMEQYPDIFGGTGTGEFILKDAAREWIDFLRTDEGDELHYNEYGGIFEFIKYFFNLEGD